VKGIEDVKIGRPALRAYQRGDGRIARPQPYPPPPYAMRPGPAPGPYYGGPPPYYDDEY